MIHFSSCSAIRKTNVAAFCTAKAPCSESTTLYFAETTIERCSNSECGDRPAFAQRPQNGEAVVMRGFETPNDVSTLRSAYVSALYAAQFLHGKSAVRRSAALVSPGVSWRLGRSRPRSLAATMPPAFFNASFFFCLCPHYFLLCLCHHHHDQHQHHRHCYLCLLPLSPITPLPPSTTFRPNPAPTSGDRGAAGCYRRREQHLSTFVRAGTCSFGTNIGANIFSPMPSFLLSMGGQSKQG